MSGHDFNHDPFAGFFGGPKQQEATQELSAYWAAIANKVPSLKGGEGEGITANAPREHVTNGEECWCGPTVEAAQAKIHVGKKYDEGKQDFTLLPFGALGEVVDVLGFGAVKYGRDNWRGVARRRYVAASFRHLVAIANGEVYDEESGKTHAAHLACCALFISELDNAK